MFKSENRLKVLLFIIGLSLMGVAIFSSFHRLAIIMIDLVGLACCGLSFIIKPKLNVEKRLTVREMSMVAVQGAISVLLYMFVKFNLPIFPQFLDMQVSEIPALITSFAYGPFAGSMVILVRFFIKLPFTGTAGVGEVADLILGLVLVVISGTIYKRKRTMKGALYGTGLGIAIAVVICCFINWLILIPFYVELFFGGSMDGLIAMCSMIPGINESNFMPLYIFVGALPFNLLRYVLVFILTFLLYKRVHFLLKKITKTN